MDYSLYEIIVGFQYAQLDFYNKYPDLRISLEKAYAKLYLNWFNNLTREDQLTRIIFDQDIPIRAMSNSELIDRLERFLSTVLQGNQTIDPDNNIQSKLLKEIQKHFNSVKLTNLVDKAYNYDN